MNSIIYIFGASCTRKSTLAKSLHHALGSDWIYIDRENLIEQNEFIDKDATRHWKKN